MLVKCTYPLNKFHEFKAVSYSRLSVDAHSLDWSFPDSEMLALSHEISMDAEIPLPFVLRLCSQLEYMSPKIKNKVCLM
jgi:hypothetical protein